MNYNRLGAKAYITTVCVTLLVLFMMPQAVFAAITGWDFPGNRVNTSGIVAGRVFYDAEYPMANEIYAKMCRANGDEVLDWFRVNNVSTAIRVTSVMPVDGILYQFWSFTLDNMPAGNYNIWVKAYDSNGDLIEGSETLINDTLTVITTGSNMSTGRGSGYSLIDIDFPEEPEFDNLVNNITLEEVFSVKELYLKDGEKLISGVYQYTNNYPGNFSVPVRIEMKFSRDGIDRDKQDIFLCYYNVSTKEWVKLKQQSIKFYDGFVSGETDHLGIFAVLAIEKESLAIEKESIETDINEPADDPATTEPKDFDVDSNDKKATDIAGHWAETSITHLMSINVVTGYPDGTFRPNNTITRAEFTTVLVKALNLAPKKGEMVFDDTVAHWADSYISTAVCYNIATGYDEFTFCPDDLITREEMATMVAKAKQLSATSTKDFTDFTDISAWAQDAVCAVASNGIIYGYPDNSFKPQNDATKAEAVTIIERILALGSV